MVIVRGFNETDVTTAEETKKAENSLHNGIKCDRHEIFAQTDMKRTLAEFESFEELVRALQDVIRGNRLSRWTINMD
jgi:hypothetical protein